MDGLSIIFVLIHASPNTYSLSINIVRYEIKKVSPSLKRRGKYYSIRFSSPGCVGPRRYVGSGFDGAVAKHGQIRTLRRSKFTACQLKISQYTVLIRFWMHDFLHCAADSRVLQLSRYSLHIINVPHPVSSLASPHPSPQQPSRDIRLCICERPRDHPTSVLCRTARTHRKTSQTRCVGVFILFSRR